MLLNEKLRELRDKKGTSQEKVAELVGVSRQAVTKWEKGQTVPSSDNLIALASIYGTSIDELVGVKNSENMKENEILQSNKTLLAIIFQAGALSVCLQPLSTSEYGLPYFFTLSFKIIPLLIWSIWMAFNLRYEKK